MAKPNWSLMVLNWQISPESSMYSRLPRVETSALQSILNFSMLGSPVSSSLFSKDSVRQMRRHLVASPKASRATARPNTTTAAPITSEGASRTHLPMQAMGFSTLAAAAAKPRGGSMKSAAQKMTKKPNVEENRNAFMHKSGTTYQPKLNEYGSAVWAGLTGEVTTFDPFRIAWDFNYGSVSYDDSHYNRAGWLGSLLFEYKLDWAIPGLYGWYASGDDDNPANGSERMPTLHTNGNNEFSNYAFSGNPYIARENTLSSTMPGVMMPLYRHICFLSLQQLPFGAALALLLCRA